MEQFFDREKMDKVVARSISDLTAPLGLEKSMQFSARRGKALLAHTQAVANLIAERVKQMYNGQAINLECLVARVARIEGIVESDFSRPLPPLLEDQITAHGVRIEKLAQQLSSLSKLVASIDRKTNT